MSQRFPIDSLLRIAERACRTTRRPPGASYRQRDFSRFYLETPLRCARDSLRYCLPNGLSDHIRQIRKSSYDPSIVNDTKPNAKSGAADE